MLGATFLYIPVTSNFCRPIEFLTSGGGSRAWSNTAHYDRHKNNLKFYHDGQGFVSVQLTKSEAHVAFYDVYGKTLYRFKLMIKPAKLN